MILVPGGHNYTVVYLCLGRSADPVVGTRHADSGGNPLPGDRHVQHPRVIGDGLVALGY